MRLGVANARRLESVFIPKGLHLSAQGCGAAATLGNGNDMYGQPCKGWIVCGVGFNPYRVVLVCGRGARTQGRPLRPTLG